MNNNHPSRRPADDAAADALVRRVAARQAEALGRSVPVDRDPDEVRLELVDQRDAAMIALATLRPDRGAAVPDAIDAATAGHPPAVFACLPVAVAVAIRDRLPDRHRQPVTDALDAALDRFEDGDRTRELAELAVHRIGDTLLATITATIADEVRADHPDADPAQVTQASAAAADIAIGCLADGLRDELLLYAGLSAPGNTTDEVLETRCRRASVMKLLAQTRGDDDMLNEAGRLAIAVCHDYPGMRPSDVFRHGAPLLMLPADPAPADVDAALVAELAALADNGAA